MRAPKNNAKGTSGQSYVKAQFEELGWSAVPNPEHDLGTDIYAGARNAEGFDLGALIGVQVKNWDFDFDKPEVHNGEQGWWFRDSEDHFTYWLDHRLPHLVALYDKVTGSTYWVHVTKEAVVSTGKGRKIFVPKSQVLNEQHLDDLIRIATSNPPEPVWEGSAWVPGQLIPVESQWRYAMLAPRLIAPHPNASTEVSNAAEAMALLTALRLDDISHRYKPKQALLDPAISLQSEDFGWRLFASTLNWVQDGNADGLHKLLGELTEPHLRAALTVTLCAALYEDGEVAQCVTNLENCLQDSAEYNPVDLAWIKTHLARNLMQIGELAQAHDLALEVAPIGQIAFNDPTARLLSGVATDMIFSLSGWRARDIAATIQARDTAAAWWRSQTLTAGLTEHLEESFKTWAEDQSITWGASDGTWLRLRSATLISGYAADTPNWAHTSSLLAQHTLMLDLEPRQVVAALDTLRISGSNKELKLTLKRILARGPVRALELITPEIDLGKSTRSSLQNDLEILGLSGSILHPDTADKTAYWIINELKNPEQRARELGLHFLYAEHLVLTLARIYISCSYEAQQSIRQHIVELPPIEEQSLAHNYAILLRNIEDLHWEPVHIEQIKCRPETDNFEVREEFEALLASREPAFRDALATRIAQGDVAAFASWGDVRDLPHDAAQGMTEHTAAAVYQDLESARRGSFSIKTSSPLRRLVLLNIWHPQSAKWQPCIEAISDPSSSPDDLIPGLKLLYVHARRIPEDIASLLREPLQRLSMSRNIRFEDSLFGRGDARGDALLLLGSLFPDEITENTLLEWLQGNATQVATAVHVLSAQKRNSALPVFASLASNEHMEVKTAVVSALTEWVVRDIGGTAAFDLLRKLLDAPGVKLARDVAAVIGQLERTDTAEQILAILERHQSAIVRRHVEVIRERWSGEP